MKVRILQPVMVGGGVSAAPGEIVEVSEIGAFNIIANGKGEAFTEPTASAPEPGTRVETRDPVPEVRDSAGQRRRRE